VNLRHYTRGKCKILIREENFSLIKIFLIAGDHIMTQLQRNLHKTQQMMTWQLDKMRLLHLELEVGDY
jgi:hypothetical protein